MKKDIFLFVIVGVVAMFSACSDISETQREFLDQGEANYVGKLDSVVVYGGHNRVEISGKKTYLRNVTKFVVEWMNMEGEKFNKEFPFEETISGDSVKMEIAPLDEGDYTFYIRSVDENGNNSIVVETVGSSYADKYKSSQSPLSIVSFIAGDKDNEYNLELSSLKDAVECKIDYKDVDGNNRSLVVNDLSGSIVLEDWENVDGSKISLTTYVLPIDKRGKDVLALEPIEQTVTFTYTNYDIDKSKCHWINLTAYDQQGSDFGASGMDAIFDGKAEGPATEFYTGDNKVPGHFCFDMGVKNSISTVSIMGRQGYCNWDIVQFELWGRETIDDGPDGDTGYSIQCDGKNNEEFVAEALQRGWKKVGDGWFKYPLPHSSPTTSTCVLTGGDNTFTPRYILFRVKSVLGERGDLGTADNETGENGGYSGNQCFNLGELSFSGFGIVYVVE